MRRIVEKKSGKKSIFIVENIVADELIDTREINVQVDTVEVKGKKYHLIYDSQYNVITDAYDFLNHNQKKRANNSLKAAIYALRYLYVFSEIIDTPIEKFNRNDFLRLNHFLSGVSADGAEYEYNLLTKRSTTSINSFFSVYREFYRFLDYDNSPLFHERSFSKYIPFQTKENRLHITEVPKYISTEDFAAIIKYIREHIKDKERRLRDECMVRIMYEGGCRLGEVLGSTLEDYVVQKVNGDDICFVYIRNRISDKEHQNAKTCMNVQSKRSYSSDTYKTKGVGYQLTFLNMDTYDLICDYIDVAHEKAYKKYRVNYDAHKADAVAEYKAKNEDNYYLFLNNRGEPLSDEGWNKELRMIFNAVGIQLDSSSKRDNLSHRFRHGFIMHLIYDLKISREKVMVRSRHRNYASLDAYYNPTTEQIVKMKTEIENNILQGSEDFE